MDNNESLTRNMEFWNQETVMKDLCKLVLTLCVALPSSATISAEKPATTDTTTHRSASTTGAYMGVFVEPVPPSLTAQLPASVPRGQGILVSRIDPDSPADAAGIHPYDILLSYDDQKLFTTEQLARLVASDQAERTVTLQTVRAGTIETRDVVLAEGKARDITAMRQPVHPFRFPHRSVAPFSAQRQETVSSSFVSLSIERVEGDRYRAAIAHLDAEGNAQRHEFEGTGDELRGQIRHSEELPPAARRQLLQALKLTGAWPMWGRGMPWFQDPFNPENLMRSWHENRWPQPYGPHH